MLLPFITWAITGVFFFIKPGYSAAYEKLSISTYPSISTLVLPLDNQWSEIKRLKSVVGEHLLVREKDIWTHINPATMEIVKTPSEQQIVLLIDDAIKGNLERYGEVTSLNTLTATTSTEVNITLNWQKMSLHQKGSDTEFISLMYQIHYLQWTGIKAIDNVLGIIGLALVIILAFMGILLSFKRVKR